ncbi:MAG: CopG family ribbon-helix-helix protein [Nitriliruptorales bacterium]
MSDSTFTFRVDDELKSAFSEVARDQERTAAQLLRVLMRDAVERWRNSLEHDAWFREQVEQALREADDPDVDRVPHDQVRSTWQERASWP